jgi:tetratricopeptide (TPR) repeat protein
MDIEVRCKVDRCFGIDRAQGKLWLESARQGDLATLRSIVESRRLAESDAVWRLMHYDGQGTSFGFVGNTALHFTCANGDMAGTQLLVELGASVNCQNNGGSTPLHAAIGHGCVEIVEYLLRRGANSHVMDCCGDSPDDVVEMLPSRGISAASVRRIANALALQRNLEAMSARPVSAWDAAGLKAAGSALGLGHIVERNELVSAIQEVLDVARASKQTCISNDENAFRFLEQAKRRYAQRMQKARENSDDEDNATAQMLQQKADAAKEKGNSCFSTGDYLGAVKHYTAALSLAPGDAVFHSNRAAAYLAMNRFYDAFKDASTAMHIRPDWPKPYLRACRALMGLGRHSDAESMALRGLELVPGDNDFTSVLSDARQAAQVHHHTNYPSVPQGRKPWFDCVLCENKTRDEAHTPCCGALVCGTCLTRRVVNQCPLCGFVHGDS